MKWASIKLTALRLANQNAGKFKIGPVQIVHCFIIDYLPFSFKRVGVESISVIKHHVVTKRIATAAVEQKYEKRIIHNNRKGQQGREGKGREGKGGWKKCM